MWCQIWVRILAANTSGFIWVETKSLAPDSKASISASLEFSSDTKIIGELILFPRTKQQRFWPSISGKLFLITNASNENRDKISMAREPVVAEKINPLFLIFNPFIKICNSVSSLPTSSNDNVFGDLSSNSNNSGSSIFFGCGSCDVLHLNGL